MIVVGIVWFLLGVVFVLVLLSKLSEILLVEVYEWFGFVIMIVCLLIVLCVYVFIWFYFKRKDLRLF